ncbi:MAG: PTS lactose/cellobiose transporter subunit IIA [Lachnospiraceae bacterium]
MDNESLAMQLIVYAGNAKSQAISAIVLAKKGDVKGAREKIKESETAMTEAHKFQTEALQKSFEEPDNGVNMLMAHAQDHLMNAITTQTIAVEFIDLYGKVEELTNLVKGEKKV